MKPKAWPLIQRCVEDGIIYGWQRAHKHDDKPDEHEIKEQIEQAILNEICEWFEFGEPGE